MELKIDLSQNMAISQRMIQSAEILQMSSLELETFIKELSIENPVVDVEENYQIETQEEDIQRKLEWLESTDEQNQVYYRQEYAQDSDTKDEWNFNRDTGENLEDYLLAQLLTIPLEEKEEEIARFMVCCLESNGYLEEPLYTFAKQFQVSEEKIEMILNILQNLEPAGVCARDLRECLLLQIKRNKMDEPIMCTIIEEYLELLGKNHLHMIAKALKISIEQVQAECEKIKHLNPKPGGHFSERENLKYIVPDITVVKLEGYYEILLNEYQYPKIGINTYYKNLLKTDTEKEAKQYISTKVKQAEWIINCVSQRNTTLLKVAKSIVGMQDTFFATGNNRKPMKLADVAQEIQMHESTVSRAIRDKYLQCIWGVFPLNYFFSKAVQMEHNEILTPDQIQEQIRHIIQRENKQKPYSDRIISEELEKENIHISRRTVAKYREAIGIRDASGRKEFNTGM